MADFNKDRIRVHIEGKEFSVVGGSFQNMLAAVKQINGRRFVGALKVWQLPGKAEDIKNQLAISGFQLEGGTPVADETPAQPSAAAPASFGNDRIRVTVQGHQLAVVGGGFREMLDAVKNLPGRRFDSDSKMWEIPGDAGIIKNLIETAGFQLEGADKIASVSPPASQNTSPPAYTSPPMPQSPPPPAYEEPDFSDDVDIPAYEPPDWWDDGNMPAPPMNPPDWWEEEEPTDTPVDYPMRPSSPARPAPRSTDSSGGGDDQIRIRIGGIPMVVTGGSFQAMLGVIKDIPGRRFHSGDKVWDIPEDSTIDSVQQVVNAKGFILKRG
ncbi:MAG: hypothetical protein KDJ65_03175 [Anaerolineae bacterium]|nr:hypothetical protein [Anaerolineae bacterium]